MKKYVYVLSEEGSWDYEFTNHTEVYANFEDALKSFKNLVRSAKLDMEEWTDEAVSEIVLDKISEIDGVRAAKCVNIYI